MRGGRPRGFTLLELLTVIAIIAVLAGLLFPTIKNALLRAEVAKAQQAVSGLAIAFKAYYTEYGKWPIATDPGFFINSNQTYSVDNLMVLLLKGSNVTAIAIGNDRYQGNPRQTVFLEFKQADLDGPGNFVDPWGRPYRFRLDISYANCVQTPFLPAAALGNIVYQGFLIWSDGPDGLEDPLGETSALNKDNVTSWR